MKKKTAILFLSLLVLYTAYSTVFASYTDVSVTQAKNMIDTNPSLVVLDVRGQDEYDTGHIRNAKLIPVGELEGRLDELNISDKILVYCLSGGRSRTASQILVDNGFLYVYNMLGGITAWKTAGYPVYIKYSSIQAAINNADVGDILRISLGTYYENVAVNKTVTLIGENSSSTIVDGNGTGTVFAITQNNVTINSFTIQNSGNAIQGTVPDAGISIIQGTNCNASENQMKDNYVAIFVRPSNNTILTENTIAGNHVGIDLNNQSEYNNVSKNYLTGNNCSIHVYHANSNVIFENNVINSSVGVVLVNSTNNSFYHNNLINNTEQVNILATSYVNSWDAGYPSGGNFWSDHNGTDLFGGPFQNETGSDEMADLPYIIDGNNQDNYPMMNPYEKTETIPGDINGDSIVDIFDAILLAGAFSSEPGDLNWDPNADLNGDDIIDIFDAIILAAHFGESA